MSDREHGDTGKPKRVWRFRVDSSDVSEEEIEPIVHHSMSKVLAQIAGANNHGNDTSDANENTLRPSEIRRIPPLSNDRDDGANRERCRVRRCRRRRNKRTTRIHLAEDSTSSSSNSPQRCCKSSLWKQATLSSSTRAEKGSQVGNVETLASDECSAASLAIFGPSADNERWDKNGTNSSEPPNCQEQNIIDGSDSNSFVSTRSWSFFPTPPPHNNDNDSSFLIQEQNRAFEKALEMEESRVNAEKEMQEQKRQIEEAKRLKVIKAKENLKPEPPEGPETLLLRIHTGGGYLDRRFSLHDSLMDVYDYLTSEGYPEEEIFLEDSTRTQLLREGTLEECGLRGRVGIWTRFKRPQA